MKKRLFVTGLLAIAVLASHAYALGITTLPVIGPITLPTVGTSTTAASSGGSSSSSLLGGAVNTVVSGLGGTVQATVQNVVQPVATVTNTIVSNVTTALTSSASSSLLSTTDEQNPLTKIPGGLTLGYTDAQQWFATSPLIQTQTSYDAGAEQSTLLTIGPGIASVQKVYTKLDSSSDWSGFKTLGIWVFPDSGITKDELTFTLSSDATFSDTAKAISISIPDLQPNVWQYVSLDISNCPKELLKNITAYGFGVLSHGAHHIHFYPPQLGPGALHHLHIKLGKVLTGNGNLANIQVVAEDRFGNVLNSVGNTYAGVKNLVFSVIDADKVKNISIGGKSLGATVATNFTNGVSADIAVNALKIPAIASLAVSDGTIGSDDGDMSLGLSLAALSIGNSGSPGTTVPSSLKSILSVSPVPGKVGVPELVTVTTYDDFGGAWPTGGDAVVAKITGANPTTITFSDLGNGIYQAGYTPSKAGTDTITATLNGSAIGSDTDGTSDGIMNLLVQSSDGGGGGGSGGTVGSYGGGGIVTATIPLPKLSDGTTCPLYMTKYIQYGKNNDINEVKKLQTFLQRYDFGKKVVVNGIYDKMTFEATKQFQKQFLGSVLSPWNLAEATGYVYVTTLREINILDCMRAMQSTDEAAVTNMVVTKAPYCPYFSIPASKGAKGKEIAKVQQFLKDMSFLDKNAPLGTYGDMTKASIKKLQAANLKNVTANGVWGPQTIKAANAILGCPTE